MIELKNRLFYLDELKALAVLFIIIIHINYLFANAENPHSLFWCFSSSLSAFGNLGVPLFVMVSGALLLNRDFEIEGFLKNRISKLLIPFAFWILITIIFKMTVMKYSFGLEEIFAILFKDDFVWFVWMLFGIYLFYPIINSFIRKFSFDGCEYFLLIWIGIIILSTFNCYPIPNLELSYFAGYLGYFVLGYYLENKSFKLKSKNMVVLGLIIFLIGLISNLYCIYHQIQFQDPYFTIFLMLESVGFFLFFKYWGKTSQDNEYESVLAKVFNRIKDSALGKMILSISICSYGMILTHYLPILIFKRIDWAINIFARNPFKWIPFMIIICLIFSWCATYFLSKMPHLKKFAGVEE